VSVRRQNSTSVEALIWGFDWISWTVEIIRKTTAPLARRLCYEDREMHGAQAVSIKMKIAISTLIIAMGSCSCCASKSVGLANSRAQRPSNAPCISAEPQLIIG